MGGVIAMGYFLEEWFCIGNEFGLARFNMVVKSYGDTIIYYFEPKCD